MAQLRQRPRPRRGVVLLVALGMLGLFSILTVSYVVFSGQARTAAAAIVSHVNEDVHPEDLMAQIMSQVVSGTNDYRSPAYMHDMLGDLYGYDSVRIRVAHFRTDSSGTPPNQEVLGGLLTNNSPLFRFPMRFASWNFDGSTTTGLRSARQIPELPSSTFQGRKLNGDDPFTAGTEANDLNTREQYDDAYTGRIATFLEGPLRGHSFRVVRSFGSDDNGSYSTGDPESILSYNLVIDFGELDVSHIEIGGRQYDPLEVARYSPGALLYGPGPDGAPGVAGVNDDGQRGADDLTEYGTLRSDDIGYLVLINGQIYNGKGVDAGFARGSFNSVSPSWSALVSGSSPSRWSDQTTTAALQPNSRYLGRRFGAEPDEGFDAADLETFFLAWQPSKRGRGVDIHTPLLLGAPANRLINQGIVPSFHRPALFNYLMNQPIELTPGDTSAKTFRELDLSDSADVNRLRLLVQRLRRACLRPLPFAGSNEDLDGDDEFMDGTPFFNGSNPTPILNETHPWPTPPPSGSYDPKLQVLRLARWLVNGPWDVDNDDDQIPDSIWLDFGLPTVRAADGTILRPLVALLIEDMDGKVNLNTAGNYAQLTTATFTSNFARSFQATNRGFGVGPGEIYPGFLLGRTLTTQTPPNPLATVFGRVLQTRYGGRTLGTVNAVDFGGPAIDTIANPNPDTAGHLTYPSRARFHTGLDAMGMPLDMFGRGQIGIDIQGNVLVSNLQTEMGIGAILLGNEQQNTPYEPATDGVPNGNDSPYTIEELVAVLQRDNPNRSSYQNRLLELLSQTPLGGSGPLAADPDLDRMITTESRSQRAAEFSGYDDGDRTAATRARSVGGTVDFFAGLLNAPLGGDVALIERSLKKMLAVELRKGTKLNLNRRLANGQDDASDPDVFVDNASDSPEVAYPTLQAPYNIDQARYVPYDPASVGDFTNLTGKELLARNLYCLMFALLRQRGATGGSTDLLIPNFPYPPNMPTMSGPERAAANAYAAHRLAQWAANVVDFRDTDASNTRLRFDEDPFDANGWDTSVGFEEVWGHEECGLQITEAIAAHNKRTRDTVDDAGEADMGAEEPGREDTNNMNDPDADMDQLRIPEPSAIVEITNVRAGVPTNAAGVDIPAATTHYPAEIYGIFRDQDNDVTTPDTLISAASRTTLDLGRVAGTGNSRTPVFRLVVGRATNNSNRHLNTPRFLSDAERLKANGSDPFNVVAQADVDLARDQYQHTVDYETGAGGLLAFEKDTPGNNRVINVDRVVWFANLNPMQVSATGRGGLNPDQIYYNRSTAGSGPAPAIAGLKPGDFAVVAPRMITRMGMKTSCNDTNNYIYEVSDQRFEIEEDSGLYLFKYYNLSDNETHPNYFSEDNSDYRIRNIVPIIAQANAPHENTAVSPDPGGTRARDWEDFYGAIGAGQRPDFGFNISGPLPNESYYRAPITTNKLNATLGPTGDTYPLFDAYYDAENNVGTPPDRPEDQRAGKPLTDRGWLSGGTHQDASTLFLQKLADPTRPYHASENPYLTVSTLSIDLHVFSGHQDLRDQVDVDGMGMMAGVDPNTPPGTFDANLVYDTRRIIPDTRRDRVAAVGAAVVKRRPAYSHRQNILRNVGAAGGGAYFPYQLRTNLAGAFADQLGDNIDGSGTGYPQTIGYVNREWGAPRHVSANLPGMPENTAFAPLAWFDREYASPYEIMMVPACSTARLGREMDLGTQADFSTLDPDEDEVRRNYRHLLGFQYNYDSANQLNNVLGDSPGFEQIFDFVDTGPIYPDDERWFNPRDVRLTGNNLTDRVTETLRAPFNNMSKHRTPGKINLNTTPDFIQNNDVNNRTHFDSRENPAQPENDTMAPYAVNAARYGTHYSGDGSVYRALSHGYSTAFELDNVSDIPRVTGGIVSSYASTQDTPFGYNFKGFIESRTGYSHNTALPTTFTSAHTNLGNSFLSHDYPSRFAGAFGTAGTATLPSLRSYIGKDTDGAPSAVRRTYDVTLLRPHPDLDRRTLATAPNPDQYDLRTESMPGTNVRSQIISTPLFERPEPELHLDGRSYDHAPMFRWRNTAKLANLTTNHSNVFMVRMTIGYFQVDPQTGEVGAEYGVATNENERQRGMFMVDRSIPAPYEEDQGHNALNTVLMQVLDQ